MKTSKDQDKTKRKYPPGKSIESEEGRLVALATDLARKQLVEGKASSQVIVHYLKLGTTMAKLEMEKLKQEVEFTKAKTENLKSAQGMEQLYKDAIKAMQTYSGAETESDDFDD